MKVNSVQTSLEELGIDKLPKDIQEEFYNFFYNVPFIQNLVREDRPRAKDLPRDAEGKIIVDVTKPHILEDMDYFRKTGLYYQKHGKYTELAPNPNPNSEYGKWIFEEVRRCHEGMVRPSDGEWIPGDLYFFWNFTEMQLADKSFNKKKSKKSLRRYGMPGTWDGHYLLFHYLHQARENGEHACMLSSRGKGKSYSGAALLAKRFELGETFDNNKGVTCYATASDKKYLVAGDQTLDKFQHNIDFLAQNTEFPRGRLANRLNDMIWIAGYKDLDKGNVGIGNSVVGITSKNDEQKLRGTRAVLYIIEEGGTFDRLLSVWANCLPSVEQGQGEDRAVFGQLFMYGTSGDKESDFAAMAEIMYHPRGYNVYRLPNVFDIDGKGGKDFSFFFGAYMNNEGCYDENGNSDVTKALKNIIVARASKRLDTSDINAVIKFTAEYPLVPQEAIMRSRCNVFPIAELNERLLQLDADKNSLDDVYVGSLEQKSNGSIEFVLSNDIAIRDYPLKDNKVYGAVEIFKMPEKDSSGQVPPNRYIAGCDPVDHDQSETMSLSSTFVLDLFTDTIVAEYTGRHDYADENYEITRRLCLFYNAKCLYENNIRGLYAYFSKMRCSYLLADTPEFLKDKDLIKTLGIGNGSKGVGATKPINDYANSLIKNWLISPKTIVEHDKDGNDIETSVHNTYLIKNRALLKELSLYNPTGNFDRVRAFGLLMIYREQFMVQYEGHPSQRNKPENDPNYIGNDAFFKQYDEKRNLVNFNI